MIEQLNSSGLQKLTTELATGFNRLQALLQIGQSVSARVVEVQQLPNPQPSLQQLLLQTESTTARPVPEPNAANTANAARPTATPAGPEGRPQPGASPPPQTAAPARTPGGETRPSPQPTTQQAKGQAGADAASAAYRTKLNVQGRLYEIITPRPLTPGTEVQLSKSADNRLQIQTPTYPRPAGEAARAGTEPTVPRVPGAPVPAASTGSRPAQGNSGGTQPSPPPGLTSQTVRPEGASQQVIARPVQPQAAPLLRTGEQIQATVVRVSALPVDSAATPRADAPNSAQPVGPPSAAATTTAVPQYRALLSLLGRSVEVELPKPPTPGTEVRVQQNANGTLTLELPSARTQAVEQALRQHLPQQQPPTQLLNLLGEAQTSGQLQRAQPLLLTLVQTLLGRAIGSPQQADAEGIRQQLNTSGTQLENRIARGDTANLQQDHKGALLRLSQALAGGAQRELPPALGERLTQMTQQAISRVLVNQLSSLPAGTQDTAGTEAGRQLQLDIPVFWQGRNENIQMQIAVQPDGESGGLRVTNNLWQVRLRFEMTDLPTMTAELSLSQGRVSVIWYGDKGLREMLEPSMEDLHRRLEQLGLEVKTLGVREQPPVEPELKTPRERLIDIKT